MQKWLGQEDFRRELEEAAGALYIVTEEAGGEAAVIEETLRRIAEGLPPRAEEWYCVPLWTGEEEYGRVRLPRGEGEKWVRDMEDLAEETVLSFLETGGELSAPEAERWLEETAARLLQPVNERWTAPELVAYQTGLAEEYLRAMLAGEEPDPVLWLPEPLQSLRERPVIWGEGLSRLSLAGHSGRREARRWHPGLMQEASGGYLLLSARELADCPGAWRCLREAMLRDRLPGPGGFPFVAQVILYGSAGLYRALSELEEDFAALFPETLTLASQAEDSPENRAGWQTYLEQRCEKEGIRLEKEAAPVILEELRREYGAGGLLPCSFQLSEGILNRGFLLCAQEGNEVFSRETALTLARRQRDKNRRLTCRFFEENRGELEQIGRLREEIGSVIGLAVLDMGYFRLAQPMRMTARRESPRLALDSADKRAGLGGKIFNKSIERVREYLGSLCSGSRQILLSCEPNHTVVEGNSAQLAQACSVLSLLGGFPICQRMAVTGALNAEGWLLPVGGITEKIEGFYDFCCWRETEGPWGVIFPAANLPDLHLARDVQEAVKRGDFFLYPVRALEECIPLLMGVPARQVLRRAGRKM